VPSLTVIRLAPVEGAPTPVDPALLHGLLFGWLHGRAPALAAAAHDAPVRPFALSPLRHGERTATLRVTALDDSLTAPLRERLAELRGADVPLALGGREWRLLPAEPEDEREETCDQIGDAIDPTAPLEMEFTSPTAFARHRTLYPLPDPALMIASWRRRWNAFAPTPVAEDRVALAEALVTFRRHRLRTETITIEGRAMIGFVGEVALRLPDRLRVAEDVLRDLGTLARYAEYCGTGVRTAMGMGQTRVRSA
jgi:CRISPR-associated endoribonuclease Cas6